MSVRSVIRLMVFLVCFGAAGLALAQPRPGRPEQPARKDNPHEAHEHFRHRRAPVGERTVPVERYFTALKRMRSMRQHSLRHRRFLPSRAELAERGISYVAGAEDLGIWSPLGPGNVGGRTRALVIDPRTPSTMYAGGVAGGVWKTTDGGGSWEPLDDIMANLAVSTLTIDPSDSNVLYAGTGEGFFNEDAARGAGIFKTRDGGLTWKQLASTNNPAFYFVNDVVISPRNPRRLYAATRTGVWRSTNGGTSWTRVVAPSVYGGCLDLALRTDTPGDDLLASCGTRKGTAAVWRNAAAEERRGGWEQVLSEPGMGRTSLAIAPSRQDVVYALASTNLPGDLNWGLSAVYRSNDGGRSWTAQVRNEDLTKMSTWLLSNAYFALSECSGSFYVNQGWYDNAVAVDPVDPDRVWAGGVDLFRSDDGGKTWGLMSYWWGKSEGYVHADQHALVFHPRYDGNTVKTLFVANDGGIYRTDDALAPAVTENAQVCTPDAARSRWTSVNHGYGVTQFYFGLPYPGGETYLGGTQDNGVIRGGETGPDAWETLVSGDAGYVAVDPANPEVLYASLTNLSFYKSTDGWASYNQADTGIDPNDNFLFVTPLVMDPSNPQRLWTGGAHAWRTDDAAASWSRASVQLGGKDSSVSTIAVAPADPDRVLAGTSEGYLHGTKAGRTATGETVWSSARPRQGHVSSVAFDPSDPAVAYATYATFGGTHVWKTADGGATWTGLDGRGIGTLPDLPVNAIAVDPGDSRRLFLATDLGVFVSTDGGDHWLVENTGFANVVTSWLAVLKNPNGSRELFAFTHGRGAWKVTLD